MKKYILIAVICLVLTSMFVSCTAEPLETKPAASTIDNPKADSFIGIEPQRPNLP